MLKLIYEPSVYVIGRQIVDDEAVFHFLANHTAAPNWHTDTEVSGQELAEVAGRVCYMSFEKPRPGGNAKYLAHILESGHGRILEHAVFTFLLAGISRSLSHELFTHTVGISKSQLSQRYVDHEDVAFVVPPALEDEVRASWPSWNDSAAMPETAASFSMGYEWLGAVNLALYRHGHIVAYLQKKYDHIEDRTARRKAAREAARSVLPNCTETVICCTANARALRHFIEMRASAAADAEINRLAIALLRAMQAEAPNIFGDYTIVRTPEGREVATTPYRKV